MLDWSKGNFYDRSWGVRPRPSRYPSVSDSLNLTLILLGFETCCDFLAASAMVLYQLFFHRDQWELKGQRATTTAISLLVSPQRVMSLIATDTIGGTGSFKCGSKFPHYHSNFRKEHGATTECSGLGFEDVMWRATKKDSESSKLLPRLLL